MFYLSLNWISTLWGLMFVPHMYWPSPSRWLFLWKKIIQTLHEEFNALLTPSHISVSTLFIKLFSMIVFNSFLGFLPYVFTSSSHMVMTLSSLPLWITLMIFGWMNHTQHMFGHLVPQGTLFILMPFMVLIETISNIIRPGTLAVRLGANMTAGHLLLTLLGSTEPSLSLSVLSILIFSQILLLVLESAVAIIQSYVFVVLGTLYTSEIN